MVLHSEDVASHSESPVSDNDVELGRATPSEHLFIVDMIVLLDLKDSALASLLEDIELLVDAFQVSLE